jgi:tRNA (adenine57-N1/adenine58-N1)-methyltransferase
MSRPLVEGEIVIFMDTKGREYMTRLRGKERFHSHHGYVEHDSVIGLEEGSEVVTSKGHPLWVFRPTLANIIMNMPRRAQIIYPKDIGVILMWADIFPGANVVEVGTGYGALTLALIRAVGTQGKVVSYEIREDFYEAVQRTVETYLGHCPQWEVRLQDASEGIHERDVDRVLVDVPEPWRLLGVIREALRPGGLLLCFTANALQVKSLNDGLEEVGGFVFPQTIEVLLRPWHVKGMSVRPAHRMTAHTGFITVTRRSSR